MAAGLEEKTLRLPGPLTRKDSAAEEGYRLP